MNEPHNLLIKRLEDGEIRVSLRDGTKALDVKIPKMRNGICVADNGLVGFRHGCHPNIDSTGSVRGMKTLGWGKQAQVIQAFGAKHNVSSISCSQTPDWLTHWIETNHKLLDEIEALRPGEELLIVKP